MSITETETAVVTPLGQRELHMKNLATQTEDGHSYARLSCAECGGSDFRVILPHSAHDMGGAGKLLVYSRCGHGSWLHMLGGE